MTNQNTVRLTVDIPLKDAFIVNDLAMAWKTNRTTALVKALRTFDLLDSAVREGETVELVAADGSRQELLFR